AAVRNIFPRRPGTCYTRHNKQKSFQFPPGNQLMALSQRLEFRQSQALVMTPQLMQAIKLLQLSSLDLAAYVDNELERNPLLERASDDDTAPNSPTAPDGDAQGSDGGDDTGGEGGAAPEAGDFAGDSAPAPDWADEKLETSRSSMEQSLGTELENVFPDADDGGKAAAADAMPGAYSEWANTGSGGSADGDYNLESFVSEATTLADHLGQQMAL